MATNFRIEAELEPDEGGFHAFCPGFPGCHTWGATRDEALANLKDAATLYIESMLAHGDPIPIESHRPSRNKGEALTVSV